MVVSDRSKVTGRLGSFFIRENPHGFQNQPSVDTPWLALNQYVLEIQDMYFSLKSTYMMGNSGSWVFDKASGDALAMCAYGAVARDPSSGSIRIAVAAPLEPTLIRLAAVLGWRRAPTTYITPQIIESD